MAEDRERTATDSAHSGNLERVPSPSEYPGRDPGANS